MVPVDTATYPITVRHRRKTIVRYLSFSVPVIDFLLQYSLRIHSLDVLHGYHQFPFDIRSPRFRVGHLILPRSTYAPKMGLHVEFPTVLCPMF